MMTGHEHYRQVPIVNQDTIRAEAARWHVASTQDEMDWDSFAEWLEEDPLHQAAYDEVASADAALDDHRNFLRTALDDPVPANDVSSPAGRTSWKAWAAVVAAASLVGVLAIPRFVDKPSATYQTQAVTKQIALGDGSTITLAPRSNLTVSGEKQENMRLSGGAWFDIRHDPARHLSIQVGDVRISDIGTRFDVQSSGAQVRVAVADGAVEAASSALDRPIRLVRGRALLFDGAGGTAVASNQAPDVMGLWRSGRLSYQNTPLSLVAADLARYAGTSVALAPALRDREFSGTFVISNGERALRDLSQVMGLELSRSGDGYMLNERKR